MKALHTNKIAAEKDAFISELLSGIPRADQLTAAGKLSAKARRLHEKYLPLHILAHYKPAVSPLKTDYFDAIISHWIESECLFMLGFRNSGMMSLRAALESALKLVYYENHPVERGLHESGKHDLRGIEFREFLYSIPGLGDLPFNARAALEKLWIELCGFVHSDLRSIATVGLVADIKSVLGLADAKFAAIAERIQDVAKTIISCCFFADSNWLLNVEKAYFDAVFDLYSTQERSAVKEKLRIA